MNFSQLTAMAQAADARRADARAARLPAAPAPTSSATTRTFARITRRPRRAGNPHPHPHAERGPIAGCAPD